MWAVKSGVTYDVLACCGTERASGFHDPTDLRRLVFKSDLEPATLKQAVRESIPKIEIVMEGSPVEEHQSKAPLKSPCLK